VAPDNEKPDGHEYSAVVVEQDEPLSVPDGQAKLFVCVGAV
jgi:hypothetical protein